IAVLTFPDNSGEGDLRHFCASLRQEIIHGLTRIRSLRVVATDPSDATGDLRELGARLNAAMLVTGSVRRAADTLRITTQIVDSARRTYVRPETVDVPALAL